MVLPNFQDSSQGVLSVSSRYKTLSNNYLLKKKRIVYFDMEDGGK